MRALSALALLQSLAVPALSSLMLSSQWTIKGRRAQFGVGHRGHPPRGYRPLSHPAHQLLTPYVLQSSSSALMLCSFGEVLRQKAGEDHGLLPTFPHHCWSNVGMEAALP